MPASPARSCTRITVAGFGLAAALAVSTIGPARAQVGPPVRLEPLGSTPAAPTVPPAERSPPPSDITADPLPPPGADGLSALGPNDRPLPAELWQGTTRATAEALIPRIKPSTSAVLQELAYRLLASPATAPEADQPDGGALLAYRAERLTALGHPDAALALLQSAPSPSEDASRVITDLAFLSGDSRAACATTHGRDPAWQNPYWDQATATCQALDGQADEAQLSLDILREAKVKDDGFAALVLKAVGIDTRLPDSLPAPQTLSLVLWQKTGQPLPKKALDGAPPAIERAVALGSGFPPDQRLAAAEKAALYGAIAPERLAEAYLATDISDEDRQSPLNRAKAAGGARGRAILFQAAHDAGQLTAKAGFLLSFLGDGRAELFPALVRAAGPMLVEVPASEDLKFAAPDFARALYALDQQRQAGAWFEMLGSDAQVGLVPLAQIAAGDAAPPWPTESLADLGGGKQDAGATRRATAAALLLTAEGVALPDQMLLSLGDASAAGLGAPAAGPAAMLASNAATGRLGGTLLALFAALGDQSLGAQPVLAAQAVAALRRVGLPDEARHLAIDIALAEGL